MANEPIKLKVLPNGPIGVLEGDYQITLGDGSVIEKRAPFSLCRCGESKQKPFCDGTHKTSGFQG